ncbi:hypothetical protein X797_008645 [Metarhizium robertsii]|uniref:Uncharacterized protein n=2 Tax=Metarhizium robertsii TaxID=568076 RepID=E9EP68_METRA|nr:uncharacterized protein MAA_01660 [Metarhizium robertsii ARSEF 23]EFZ02078.1 hypothetical protein MAA_01660 [Metarhizium robertsii ARSEF 23]EXU98255.1 hypothetical protein X797_008645 [Metarhizium robertsii]
MKTSIILPVLLNLAMANAARKLADWEQTPETILKDNAELDIACQVKGDILECHTDEASNPRQQNLLPLCKQIGGCGCANLLASRWGDNKFAFDFICRSLQKELDV